MRRLTTSFKSLAGQFTLLLVLALVAANIATYLVLDFAREREFRTIQRDVRIERLIALVPSLNALAPELRSDVVRAASNRRLRIKLTATPEVKNTSPDAEAVLISGLIKERLEITDDNLVHVQVVEHKDIPRNELKKNKWDRKQPMMQQGQSIFISLRLQDGIWLNALHGRFSGHPRLPRGPILLALFVTFISVLGVGLLFIRRITRPLKELSSAANKAGRGDRAARMVEAGPKEIRDAARAFNAMQVDIEQFEVERARTIAAVGHDLRTPITSLRIRAEMMEDDDLKEPMIDTLDGMQVMADELLYWGRSEVNQEPTKEINLTEMLNTVCKDTTILFSGNATVLFLGRPVALQRALTNLVENTQRYAGKGKASLSRSNDAIIIEIEDNGPGLAPEQLETIFKPFTRGENSRSNETGGHGLGLSIAQSIIRSHGGDITLRNKTDSDGLIAKIVLPV